jgi:hypothetical protein
VSPAGELLSRWAPMLLFSKKAAGRFPKPGEVAAQFEKKFGPALDWRKRSN